MRHTRSFPAPLHFQDHLLGYLADKEQYALLTSNEYYKNKDLAAKPYYHTYDLIAGIGATKTLALPAGEALLALQALHDRTKDWLLGFFSYDLKNEFDTLSSRHPDPIGLPDLYFFRPGTLITLQGDTLTIACLESDPEEVYTQILAATPLEGPALPAPADLLPRFGKGEYMAVVEALREHIAAGDVYEINFCQEFYKENIEVSPLPLFRQLMEVSPNPFAALLRFQDKYILSSSMERFLCRQGNKLISQPIKGTIRKSADPLEDAALQQQLRNDPKEQAENVMIVDLVRNDLAWSATTGSVQVEELFGIYPFSQLHQMISTVTAEMKPALPWTEAIRRAFPMGSMTGAPKRKCMELIEAYERSRRGIYSGAIGYITPEGNFDFNVVIRTLVYNALSRYLSVHVGSAITYDSIPEKEYEECLVKISGIQKALKATGER